MRPTGPFPLNAYPHTSAKPDYSRTGRYADNWIATFESLYMPFVQPGVTVLDVGSGRRPILAKEKRPEGVNYIGLDISKDELLLAPEGSYDQSFAIDLRNAHPELTNKIDLILSWQVFEHIHPLTKAIENCHSYLRSEGHLVALLSGRNSVFALANRIIPERLGVWAMHNFLGRPPDTVFRAHYDQCTYSELQLLFRSWTSCNVTPLFRGASYFQFNRALKLIYLQYEDWIANRSRNDAATHYHVFAQK